MIHCSIRYFCPDTASFNRLHYSLLVLYAWFGILVYNYIYMLDLRSHYNFILICLYAHYLIVKLQLPFAFAVCRIVSRT